MLGRMKARLILSSLLIALALYRASALAADIVLELPLDCEMNVVCTIQNYVDRDPGPEYRDYACGRLTYNGHGGTDFRVPDLTVMRRGVDVLAAAPGTVRAVRDGVEDVSVTVAGIEAVKDFKAGNAVVVEHGGGWETQYSHLMKGSVRVKKGQRVEAGQVLGRIGMSGLTEFPHVHFEVRLNGDPVDPFVGPTDRRGCGFTVDPLWSGRAAARLPYTATGLLSAGMTSAVPKPEDAREGRHRAEILTLTAPLIVFWVDVFGIQAGDVQRISLTGPGGEVLAAGENALPEFKVQYFAYVGKPRPGGPWPEGEYTGRYVLLRNENGKTTEVLNVTRTVLVK